MLDAATNVGYLRPMIEADLESILKLRNHFAVRCHMLTQHEISIEEHQAWFQQAAQNPRIELLVFELNAVCCGFVQFKETNFLGVVDWGFYSDPSAPQGTGRQLGLAAVRRIFKNSSLHKICGQALHGNEPSIKLHKSLGFTQEGILREQHFDGTSHHDLICYGLLKREWIAKNSMLGTYK